jgi:hypothetical protein
MKINNSQFFNNKTNYFEPLSFFVYRIKNKLNKNTFRSFFRYKKITQQLKQHIIYYEKIVLNSSHKSISQKMTSKPSYNNYININNLTINLNQETFKNYMKIYNFCLITDNFKPLFEMELILYNVFLKEYKTKGINKNELLYNDIQNILKNISDE